jgi:hypothetical protein
MRHSSVVRPLLAGAIVAAALVPSSASAAGGSTAASGQPAFAGAAPANARMAVTLDVTRFRATQNGTVAEGTATARLRGLGGMPTTVTKKVRLTVAQRGTCRILRLVLEELDLTLLGLNVHLDKVDLRVTGERRGGILGRLFCSLANARVRASRAAAARKVNSEIARKGTLRPLAVAVPVQAVAAQAQTPTCPVLDLTVGPLHVELLGLIVDLNRVRLTITAIRGGGVLGDLFCGLAGRPLPVA